MKKYVIANFKMNKVDGDISKYLSTLIPLTSGVDSQIILAVPSVSIKTAVSKAGKSGIMIAAQNLNENNFGSFTGEINGEMISGVGAGAVLIGHSERRTQFGESDELVNKKLLAAMKTGLVSILCIGETIFDKTNGLTEKTLTSQLTACLKSLYANELSHLVIAYEPVWAIGTGVTPTNDEISKAIKFIRGILKNMYDEKIAADVSIVYGGSITDYNIKEIAKIPNVDGVLVGGASLSPEKFGIIVNTFDSARKK